MVLGSIREKEKEKLCHITDVQDSGIQLGELVDMDIGEGTEGTVPDVTAVVAVMEITITVGGLIGDGKTQKEENRFLWFL